MPFITFNCFTHLFLYLFSFHVLFVQSNDARNSPKDLLKDNSISFNNNNNSNSRNLNVTGMGATKDDRSSISDQAFHCSASSVESLPSASGSSKYQKP